MYESAQENIDLKKFIIIFLMMVVVMFSAILSAYSVHLTRQNVGYLSELNRQQDGLQIEWEKLLLEINMLTGYNRIEAIAIKKIGMQAPVPGQMRVIELGKR